MTVDELIGERVHQAMWRRQRQQTEVAPAMGLDQSTLSRKIRGKRPWTVREVYLIAEVLGVDPVSLLPAQRELGPIAPVTSPDAVAESKCIPPQIDGSSPLAQPWTPAPGADPLRRTA